MIPVGKPVLTTKDKRNLFKIINSGWISSGGPEINKLEKNFANFLNYKYAVAVSSGTAALEISIKSLNLKPNDEVIIPNFTIFSSALCVIKQNAIPVPVDCDLKNWNMNIEDIEKKITKKTKVIIATHIFGFPLDMEKIKKIAKKKKIYIIEDAAELLGGYCYNKKCGSYGDISTFSFYANKNITGGEGGIICTNSKKIYLAAKSLSNLCFGKKEKFIHTDIGWNYRITSMQASLINSQLSRLPKIISKKISIGKKYFIKLKDNKNIYIQPPMYKKLKNYYWVVGILVKNTKIKKKLSNYLKKNGVETRNFFYPINKQPLLMKKGYKFGNGYNNSYLLYKTGIYLPSYLNLKDRDIYKICRLINEFF